MEETEKMAALKKAYAETILNTTKEGAARVMAAEIKAQRHQMDLISTKEEAVRMLLRLKHLIDTQKREAEIMCLNKQMRINELEAQLDEAEGVIIDLRAKLSHVEDQLEIVKDKYNGLLTRTEIVRLPGEIKVPTTGQSYFVFPHSLSKTQPTPVISEVQIPLPKPSILVHECMTSLKQISRPSSGCGPCPVNTPVFYSGTTKSKKPEPYNDECCQRVQASETISLPKPSTLVHKCVTSLKEIARPSSRCDFCPVNIPVATETISLLQPCTIVHESLTSSKEIVRQSSGCDTCPVNGPVFASGTSESKEHYRNKCSQRVQAIETCLAADKLHKAQETGSLPQSDPRTNPNGRYAELNTLSCLRTDKSGMESFVRKAVFHNDIIMKDQPVKVRRFQRRRIRYGKRKACSGKRRSASSVMPQQTSVTLTQWKSSVSSKVGSKSGDTPTKVKSVSNIECMSRLDEKVQLQRMQDTLLKESCLNNNFVECQVRECQGALEVDDEGKTKEGIHVKEAFANACMLGEVEKNSSSAGISILEDINLIDISTVEQDRLPSHIKLESTCIAHADCKISENTEAPHQPDTNRAIIHTFSRKRKNRSVLQFGEINSTGKFSLKKRCGVGNDVVLVSGNRNLADESSGGSRQSLQVAHQC